jgi:hypothetical protein
MCAPGAGIVEGGGCRAVCNGGGAAGGEATGDAAGACPEGCDVDVKKMEGEITVYMPETGNQRKGESIFL